MSSPAKPISDPTTGKPPRPRRWIPVSLGMFVALLLVVGVASGLWIGVPAYRQLAIIQEIEGLGGTVDCVPIGPKWLRRWVGDENMRMFDEIVSVRLADT